MKRQAVASGMMDKKPPSDFERNEKVLGEKNREAEKCPEHTYKFGWIQSQGNSWVWHWGMRRGAMVFEKNVPPSPSGQAPSNPQCLSVLGVSARKKEERAEEEVHVFCSSAAF